MYERVAVIDVYHIDVCLEYLWEEMHACACVHVCVSIEW